MFFKTLWKSNNDSLRRKNTFDKNSLREVGALIKNRREQYGLSLQELAVETRITTAVLEAIEEGWIERLPEPAYLSAMLSLLESYLEIPRGSCNDVLKAAFQQHHDRNANKLLPFTPGNIDILTTWQGGLLYFFLVIMSIVFLNHQYKSVSEKNSISLSPFAPSLSTPEKYFSQTPLDEYQAVVSATRGSTREWLEMASRAPAIKRVSGDLVMKLINSKSVKLRSSDGSTLNLNSASGTISLTLLPPILIEINPPLSFGETLLWNGKRYLSESNQPGLYRLPNGSTNSTKNLLERPQNDPRS